MKTLLKLVGGLTLGVALGAGVIYLVKNAGADKKEENNFPEPEPKSLPLKEETVEEVKEPVVSE